MGCCSIGSVKRVYIQKGEGVKLNQKLVDILKLIIANKKIKNTPCLEITKSNLYSRRLEDKKNQFDKKTP